MEDPTLFVIPNISSLLFLFSSLATQRCFIKRRQVQKGQVNNENAIPALKSLICVEVDQGGVFLATFTSLHEPTEAPYSPNANIRSICWLS